jgi:hypothetical protein
MALALGVKGGKRREVTYECVAVDFERALGVA